MSILTELDVSRAELEAAKRFLLSSSEEDRKARTQPRPSEARLKPGGTGLSRIVDRARARRSSVAAKDQ